MSSETITESGKTVTVVADATGISLSSTLSPPSKVGVDQGIHATQNLIEIYYEQLFTYHAFALAVVVYHHP